ncbi:hypothetical protein [Nonomuraea longicatena]|uniref:Uncharacterized protein n=1 Tax=Nonomuraea longicatena TaxID=83682 RepID=A0ABN1NXI6_9ACTN
MANARPTALFGDLTEPARSSVHLAAGAGLDGISGASFSTGCALCESLAAA